MGLERSLKAAFCEGFRLRKIPIGYVIITPFSWLGGEPLILYARAENGMLRFEDSGGTLALLEDSAGDLGAETRLEALYALAAEHGVVFDEADNKFYTQWSESAASEGNLIAFVSFMNRIQDMQLLSKDRVSSVGRLVRGSG